MQGNDPWLRLLYTSLELIRSRRVLAGGNTHNVLSVVTYQCTFTMDAKYGTFGDIETFAICITIRAICQCQIVKMLNHMNYGYLYTMQSSANKRISESMPRTMSLI